jgi:subtilase family serine protease
MVAGSYRLPAKARVRGSAPAELKVYGTLNFRLTNEAELDQLILDQSNPKSANYHRWLTPQEFGQRYGARPEAYQATINWLRDAGIKVTRAWKNRLGLEFEGDPASFERAFGVHMNVYDLEGETHYANENSPQLPAEFADEVVNVKLHNFLLYHALYRRPQIRPEFGSGSRVSLGPQDLDVAYNIKPLMASGIDGSGQNIGIVGRTDFDVADVDQYRSTFKLPPTNLVKIPAGAGITDRGDGEKVEILLDTEVSGGLAPMAMVQAVIADGSHDVDQSLAFIINEMPDTKVISMSFGECERDLFPTNETQAFGNVYKQASAQGQTVLVSSGDDGANDCQSDNSGRHVSGLAASPFVTAVGGTSLNAQFDNAGDVTGYGSEDAWQGSGGGVSVLYVRPAYQTPVKGLPGTMRGLPDISLIADPGAPGYFIIQDGHLEIIGGTSGSSPAWAGIFALVNQFNKTNGLGLVNPRLYELGLAQQSGGTAVYNDVKTGNNDSGSVAGFPAQPGYDLSTGWGSPNTNQFARNFVSVPDGSSGLFLTSPNGGDFLDDPFTINWHTSDDLAAKITSQDLFLSTDSGQTFTPIAMGLDKDMRSFDFNSMGMVVTTARFRVTVHTDGQDVSDSSDTDSNIGTLLRIEMAQFTAPNKLTVLGEDVDVSEKLIVNNAVVNRKASQLLDGSILYKGGMAKLHLRKGPNTIVVEVNGVKSAPFILNL